MIKDEELTEEDIYGTKGYFETFVKERNITNETIKGYKTAIKQYCLFHNKSIESLIDEAIEEEDDKEIKKRDRRIKGRLVDFRTFLMENKDIKYSTMQVRMRKILALYSHFDIDIPNLPKVQNDIIEETTYFDLPNKKHIKMALESTGIMMQSLILFMASSGTGREECANITIKDFIVGCKDYITKESLSDIIEELYSCTKPIVPTLYIERMKTKKRYYTFCTPEATDAIIKWLILRLERAKIKKEELSFDDKLWGMKSRKITYHFTNINDELNFGYINGYRFFRPHTLRKFNSSNIGLSQENIDAIQGRSKDKIHATYIKTNPDILKKKYMNAMENVTIGDYKKQIVHEDITVNINLNFYGQEYGVSL